MNAKEARIKSLKITGDIEKAQYADIKNQIDGATEEGKLECNIYEYPTKSVEKLLIDEGFSISKNNGRPNEVMLTISW